jgi:hypothetical protein
MSFDFTGLRVATEKIVLRFNGSGWTHVVFLRTATVDVNTG